MLPFTWFAETDGDVDVSLLHRGRQVHPKHTESVEVHGRLRAAGRVPSIVSLQQDNKLNFDSARC